jgi:hypothetical protein
VGNEGLYKLVGLAHVVQDRNKVVLGSAQQVWAKHNGERFRRHLIALFIVRNSGKQSLSNINPSETEILTCQGVLRHA